MWRTQQPMLWVRVKLLVKSDWSAHTLWQDTSLVLLTSGYIKACYSFKMPIGHLLLSRKIKKDQNVIAIEKSTLVIVIKNSCHSPACLRGRLRERASQRDVTHAWSHAASPHTTADHCSLKAAAFLRSAPHSREKSGIYLLAQERSCFQGHPFLMLLFYRH